jgi:phosphatidate phosphatase APP1
MLLLALDPQQQSPDADLSGSPIRADETVLLYPTAAALDPTTATWIIPIHGVVFEPSESSWRRRAMISTLRRAMGVDSDSPQAELFEQRMRLFLVDHERGKGVAIRIGTRRHEVGISEENGHFYGTIRLPADEAALCAKDGWLPFEAVLTAGDERQFAGRARLVPPQGLSVISDIDDTVRVSRVGDFKAMLRSAFCEEFTAVQNMPETYRLCTDRGAVFHYVSASPWQLFEPLCAFFKQSNLPEGTLHLRHYRLDETSLAAAKFPPDELKSAEIEKLLIAYPGRRFLLFGDSGQRDPEVYGHIARKFGDQVLGVFVREVEESPEPKRYEEAFRGVHERCLVFEDAAEIRPRLEKLFEQATAVGPR